MTLTHVVSQLLALKLIGKKNRSGHWGHVGIPGHRGGSASRYDRALRWLQDKKGGAAARVGDLEDCFEFATGNKDSWVYLQDLEITDPKTGFNAEITEITESYGDIHIVGRINAQNGNQIGTFSRFFSRSGDVHHSSFEMDENVQGRGFGTIFYKQSEDAYVRMGMKTVSLFADMDIGGYAWARMGFDWKYHDVRRFFNESFLAEYARRAGPNDPPSSSLPYFEHPWELAAYQRKLASGDIVSGKEFLLGKSWDGVKFLNPDSLSYQVGREYYKAKGLSVTPVKRGNPLRKSVVAPQTYTPQGSMPSESSMTQAAYEDARARVASNPALTPYKDDLLSYRDTSAGLQSHYNWVASARTEDILDWVREVRRRAR